MADEDDSYVDEYDALITVTEPDELRMVVRTYT
jgi:hypothetical protein